MDVVTWNQIEKQLENYIKQDTCFANREIYLFSSNLSLSILSNEAHKAQQG